jgi:hypothetical protein
MPDQDDGQMLAKARLVAITERLVAVLDDEKLTPHNQVWMLAHALSCCAAALGAPLKLVQDIVKTRYAAAEAVAATYPGKRP